MAGVVFPGDVLSGVGDAVPGPGTYATRGKIRASVCGIVERVPAASGTGAAGDAAAATIQVFPANGRTVEEVPSVGASVVARVTRIAARQATLEILSVNGHVPRSPFMGIIRKVDAREFEVDKVAMHDCFLPGDVVRAEVLSLGDSKAYFLTTAREDLGVVHAVSAAGAAMVPRSWEEMQCPITTEVEKRKVARLSPGALALQGGGPGS